VSAIECIYFLIGQEVGFISLYFPLFQVANILKAKENKQKYKGKKTGEMREQNKNVVV